MVGVKVWQGCSLCGLLVVIKMGSTPRKWLDVAAIYVCTAQWCRPAKLNAISSANIENTSERSDDADAGKGGGARGLLVLVEVPTFHAPIYFYAHLLDVAAAPFGACCLGSCSVN